MTPTDDMLADDPAPLDPPPRWTVEEYDPETLALVFGPLCWDDEDPPDLPPEEA